MSDDDPCQGAANVSHAGIFSEQVCHQSIILAAYDFEGPRMHPSIDKEKYARGNTTFLSGFLC